MQQALEIVVGGLLQGGAFALVALGFALIYRVTGMLNLAQGAFVIATAAGQRIAVIQIAGLVARRIVPFAREGEAVAAGQRIGMIRFGSRVDVYLPEGARPLVGEGQTAIAGETVLADLQAAEPNRAFSMT